MKRYQGTTALFDNKRISENEGAIHSHKNGLSQINISNNDGYCALFIVHTPAVDDSGVAHAVEHFVFRRSKMFNDPTSLFQLTSLTDLLINASTMSDVSYFHCQSRCKSTFDLGLRYLLNGLLTPEFSVEDLSKEIYDGANCGVIYRELNGIYQEITNKIQYQIGLSDISDNRSHQHGGYCSTIGQLTVKDLIKYHGQHYHPEKITLVTANTDIERVATLLKDIIPSPSKVTASPRNNAYCPKLPQSIKKYDATKHLIRFWVSIDFYYYFEHHYQSLETLLLAKKSVLVPLQPDVNRIGLFALNIIVNNTIFNNKSSDDISLILNQFITKNPLGKSCLKNKKAKHQNPKYSPAINRLLDCYYTKIVQSTSDGQLIINAPTIHQLAVIDNKKNALLTDLGTALQPDSNTLISPLQSLAVSLKSPSKNFLYKKPSKGTKQQKLSLPKLLTSLYQQAIDNEPHQHCCDGGLAVATDRNNCIVVVQIAQTNTVLAALASFIVAAYPPFLTPRTQGHCYLIGARYLEQSRQLVIFSVLDVSPVNRLSAISHDLLLLSQDIQFILKSLTLAKIKLTNEYQLDMLDVKDISTTALVEFLNELSISLSSVLKYASSSCQ